MVIKNDAELLAVLGVAIEQVINNVSDRVIVLLQENIKRYVLTQESDWYERTGEFINAFRWDQLHASLNNFSRMLFYDPTTMHFDMDKFIHGSPWGGDATDNLADILNVEGYTSSLQWKLSHPYWDITIRQLFDGGQLENIFREEFLRVGLHII
jgi:hypothetical protein